MQHFTIKRSIPVGNHFHSDKDEDFYFLSGGGQYYHCRVDADGRILLGKKFSVRQL